MSKHNRARSSGSDKQGSDGALRLDLSDLDIESIQKEATRRGCDVAAYLLSLHQEASGHHKVASRNPDFGDAPVATYKTRLGQIYRGDSRRLMLKTLKPESVDLIMTSPPYALVYKKDYGNEDADRYLDWFRTFVPGFNRVLKPEASLVVDIGGVWKKGRPTRGLYHYELLVMLCREYGYNLAQEFYWWNPAKLPTPAEWVNVRRIRVKDAVNCIWWLSKSEYPRASNRRVLQEYSQDMKRLLKCGYRHKQRPSGHNISAKFRRNNKGSIPPNLLALANNEANSAYRRYCQEHSLTEHPAQFPRGIPAFFIRMLTDEGDLVLDPFAGSCVTGEVADAMGRRWSCCEILPEYVEAGRARFMAQDAPPDPATSMRTEPYQVSAPCLGLVSEDKAPLAADGGRKPKKRGRKGKTGK